MSTSNNYEKIVKVEYKGKHMAVFISAIMGYVLFFSIWLAAAFSASAVFVPVITAGGLSTFLLVWLTSKYISLEYEYSFWYGQLTLSKIYGKKSRKTVAVADIKDMLMIAPATEEYIAKAEHFSPDKRVIAVSSEDAENIWLLVSGGEDEPKILVFFEADERSLSILRSANPIAFIRKL